MAPTRTGEAEELSGLDGDHTSQVLRAVTADHSNGFLRRPTRRSGPSPVMTTDHVPPQNLFARPLPANIAKIPSCPDSNGGASKDDEYFRLIVALRHDIDHADAVVAREAALRSLNRPQAPGLRASLLFGTREAEVRSDARPLLRTLIVVSEY